MNFSYHNIITVKFILGTWTSVATMCKSRGAGVGVVNGVLFAVGGHSESEYLNSVEVYLPSADVWTFVSNMHNY